MSEDKALPTALDAEQTHAHFPRWNGIAPLPNARMMLHVGAETVENFLVVGDAWGQFVASELDQQARVLDIGCGCARTARTLLHLPNIVDYLGFDVVRPYIDWNNRFIAPLGGGRFRFVHLDVRGPRYNPGGTVAAEDVVFPAADASASLALAASLFTHLKEAAALRYLQQSRRVLVRGGKLVASIHIQPEGDRDFSGDEFRADFHPRHFLEIAESCGFASARNAGDVCGQETFVLRAK